MLKNKQIFDEFLFSFNVYEAKNNYSLNVHIDNLCLEKFSIGKEYSIFNIFGILYSFDKETVYKDLFRTIS